MAVDGAVAGIFLLVGRIFYGAVLAFMGVNHFQNVDSMAGYADAKGLPAPRASVLTSGAILVLGGLGIVFGVLPVVAAGAVAVFLLVSAVTMHDFWAVPDDQQQDEMTQFLKNVSLAGGALAFLVLANETWPYAVNVGLF